jgi:hypothetical protein
MFNSPFALDTLIAIGCFCFAVRCLSRKRTLPRPPGPPGYPIIGNVLDMPSVDECVTFTQWRDTYGLCFIVSYNLNREFIPILGDLVSLNCAGTVIVVCNSYQKSVELLDKKSSIYSDRANAPMATDLVGWKNNLAFLPYGKRFREGRKLFHQEFGTPNALIKFYRQEEDESLNFLRRLLEVPEDFERSISK